MRSIRRFLITAIWGWLLLALCLAFLGFYLFVRHKLQSEFDSALLARARALATQVELERDGSYELEFSDEIMPEYSKGSHYYFQVWLHDGMVLQKSPSLGDNALERKIPLSHDWQADDVNLPEKESRNGRAIWLEFLPVIHDDQDRDSGRGGPSAIVVVAGKRRDLDHTLSSIQWGLTGLAILIPLFSGLIVAWGVDRGLRPLQQVANHAQKLDADNLKEGFETNNLPVELKPIAGRLNELLSRIGIALERERRFNADLAHELRTPLAEARTSLEVAKRWPAPNMQQNALDSLAQLETLVAALLDISRGQMGREARIKETFEINSAVREAWNVILRQKQEAESTRFELNASADITVNSDRILIGRVLQNLLANAIDYGVAGGIVSCAIHNDENAVVVEISNHTDSLSDVDVAHVFDSFWRKDQARTGDEHRGLGLTLVKSFCHILGVQASASLSSSGIFTARLRFPTDKSDEAKAPIDIIDELNQDTVHV